MSRLIARGFLARWRSRSPPRNRGRYGSQLDRRLGSRLGAQWHGSLNSPTLQAEIKAALQPAEPDKLARIRSHVLRKTTAAALDQAGHIARQIADQLGAIQPSHGGVWLTGVGAVPGVGPEDGSFMSRQRLTITVSATFKLLKPEWRSAEWCTAGLVTGVA
ncbi:hypothetical protein [Kribbella sp. NBC_00359]|uniref:hypothetical protein n=1 Tax=Kribbella sp. NBC_00359 TaxID=2975966 RepID=UPI002E1BE071